MAREVSWAVLSQPSLQWTTTDVFPDSTLSAIFAAPANNSYTRQYTSHCGANTDEYVTFYYSLDLAIGHWFYALITVLYYLISKDGPYGVMSDKPHQNPII